MSLAISVPNPHLLKALREQMPDADLVLWDLRTPAPRQRFDIVVTPYLRGPSVLTALAGLEIGLVQSQTLGYDGAADFLPEGLRYANAVGVHEASTAELAVGMMIAMQRRFPEYVHAQDRSDWDHQRSRALADSRVLVVGIGGVGQAIIDRLLPFEVEVVRVASGARTDAVGRVHGTDELPALVTEADIVVLAVPLSTATTGMIGAGVLSAMRPGTLLVNVGRGPLVDTDALVDAVQSGGVRAALDVVDPEPLPPGHPLWSLPGVFVTPHVGGHTEAMAPRVVRLVRDQAERMRAGMPPHNVVLPAPG
ncbi:MAG: 2-hydroxyacid dehydrogenase [Nocardioidaceae bacterium]